MRVKSTMTSFSARLSYKLASFSTERKQNNNVGVCIAFLCMAEIVVCLESSLDTSFWEVQDDRHLIVKAKN